MLLGNTDLSIIQAAIIAKVAHRHRTLAPEDPPEQWTVLDFLLPVTLRRVPDIGLAASTRTA